MRPNRRLTVAVAALTVSGTVVCAPAAVAQAASHPIVLECDDMGAVVAAASPGQSSVQSLTPGVLVVAGPHSSTPSTAAAVGTPRPAGATAPAAPTVPCTGPDGARYAVVSDAASPDAPTSDAQATAVQAQAAAASAFPFQAELAAYLATRSGSVTVAAQARGGPMMVYTKGEATNVTASIVKVQVMATVMRRAQERGRGLTSWEKSRIVPMIRYSDNAATTDLWNYVGGGAEVSRVDRLMGMTSTTVSSDGRWGLTVTTAPDNVILMNHFGYANTVLSDNSRAYGLSLMDSITTSQDWGVSAGPPAGTVQLKNGWLPRSDGWHVNSIGFSSSGPTPYSIGVLTHSTTASMATQVATIEGASRIVWKHATTLRGGLRGDWDQTRTTDLLGTSATGGLYFYPGNGAGSLGARTSIGSGWDGMRWVGSPGDVDRDGKADLLAVNASGLMYLYRGRAARSFSAAVEVGNGWQSISAIATPQDFDGNGTLDLLARYADGTLGQYSIATTGRISRIRTFGNGWGMMRAILGSRDFTGDGRGDLLGVGNDGSLRAYASTGTGLRTLGVVGSGWQTIPQVAVPGDLNGDGIDDVVALTDTGALMLYGGRLGGGLRARTSTGASGTGLVRLV